LDAAVDDIKSRHREFSELRFIFERLCKEKIDSHLQLAGSDCEVVIKVIGQEKTSDNHRLEDAMRLRFQHGKICVEYFVIVPTASRSDKYESPPGTAYVPPKALAALNAGNLSWEVTGKIHLGGYLAGDGVFRHGIIDIPAPIYPYL